MKNKKFALSNAQYYAKRNWSIVFMDRPEIVVRKSIEEMMHYMRQLYATCNVDYAVCNTDCWRIFIDGNDAVVIVSLANNKVEFHIGYEITPLLHYRWSDEKMELRDIAISSTLLQDYFSPLMLSQNFIIK